MWVRCGEVKFEKSKSDDLCLRVTGLRLAQEKGRRRQIGIDDLGTHMRGEALLISSTCLPIYGWKNGLRWTAGNSQNGGMKRLPGVDNSKRAVDGKF